MPSTQPLGAAEAMTNLAEPLGQTASFTSNSKGDANANELNEKS